MKVNGKVTHTLGYSIFSIALVFLMAFLLLPAKAPAAYASGESWFDNEWAYRQEMTVNNTANGTLTDYQVKLTVYAGTGNSSGSSVYLNGHGNADFSDIRFTAADGETTLSYWVETADIASAVVWVKLDEIPAYGTGSYFIYYGSASAPSASSGNATFVFFDDFEMDLSQWNNVHDGGTGSISLQTGIVKEGSKAVLIDDPGKLGQDLIYKVFPEQNIRLTYYFRPENTYSDLLESYHFFSFDAIDSRIHARLYGTSYEWWDGINFHQIDTLAPNAWYKMEFTTDLSSRTFDFYRDDSLKAADQSMYSVPGSLTNIQLTSGNNHKGRYYFDQVRIAKYVSPEPTFGTWGDEEQRPNIDDEAPAAVEDLATGNTTTTTIMLTWTAPGDDGNNGTATQYDIRYATSSINGTTWNYATQVSGEPMPQAAGNMEYFMVTGLDSNTTYYFALKTADEVPNWSEISNIASGTTLVPLPPDDINPAAIDDLVVASLDDGKLVLTWTATGDDGYSGNATSYEIRYATSPITNDNWASATGVNGEPVPLEAGSKQAYIVTDNLSAGTYYFAIRAADEVGNLSNIYFPHGTIQ